MLPALGVDILVAALNHIWIRTWGLISCQVAGGTFCDSRLCASDDLAIFCYACCADNFLYPPPPLPNNQFIHLFFWERGKSHSRQRGMIDPVLYDPPGGEGTSASPFSVMQPPSFPAPKLGSDGGYPAGTEMSPCTNSCHSDSSRCACFLVCGNVWSVGCAALLRQNWVTVGHQAIRQGLPLAVRECVRYLSVNSVITCFAIR